LLLNHHIGQSANDLVVFLLCCTCCFEQVIQEVIWRLFVKKLLCYRSNNLVDLLAPSSLYVLGNASVLKDINYLRILIGVKNM
jgi:hypothetical protein